MNPENNIKLMIVSNQILYIDALRSLLREEKQVEVVGQSLLNPNIIITIQKHLPQIILLDANGMDKSIWDFVKHISEKQPKVKIILLANVREQVYIEAANKSGAVGFVLKSSPKELLIAAIKIVADGGSFFDPGTNPFQNHAIYDELQNSYHLSIREIEIIKLIKDGLSTKEIATNLQISHFTVETHRKNIYQKLRLNKVADLIRFATEHIS